MTAMLKVLQAGLYTTIQDMGRWGYQDVGVPVSGALDKTSAQLANVLVGNPQNTPVLEMLLQGPSLSVQSGSVRVALFGGDGALVVTGARRFTVPAGHSIRLVQGDEVKVAFLGKSFCSYLAVEGGLNLPLQMGSASTYVRGGIGGLKGRALRRGDILRPTLPEADTRAEKLLAALYDYGYAQPIRVVPGPQDDYFTASAKKAFFTEPYVVTNQVDRMGFRLEGPQLQHSGKHDLVSDGIVSGAIQVPGSGQPIVLLADAQTTGGYPKIATVISSDIPVLARRRPGSVVRFQPVSLQQAEALARDLEARLRAIADHGLKDAAPLGKRGWS